MKLIKVVRAHACASTHSRHAHSHAWAAASLTRTVRAQDAVAELAELQADPVDALEDGMEAAGLEDDDEDFRNMDTLSAKVRRHLLRCSVALSSACRSLRSLVPSRTLPALPLKCSRCITLSRGRDPASMHTCTARLRLRHQVHGLRHQRGWPPGRARMPSHAALAVQFIEVAEGFREAAGRASEARFLFRLTTDCRCVT
jgi:hypothetical protein